MTPQEKAKEIFKKMYHVDDVMGNYPMCFDTAKQCALIAVDEILRTQIDITDKYLELGFVSFWTEVKQEIENYE